VADTPAKKAPSKKGKIALYGTLAVGGIALAWWLYQRYVAGAASGTTSGTPLPSTTTAGPAAATTPPITTLAEWKQAVLAAMVAGNIKGGENTAALALSKALSGQCLGPVEFTSLNAALGSVGQPPGTGILTLQLCRTRKPPTTSHTPSETPPKGRRLPTPHVPAANRRRDNAIDAARRRANEIAAATRRRAAHLKPPHQAAH
jgi:hypothetical protein